MGARRIEITEEHKIYQATTVFFRAGSEDLATAQRRTMSLGPGLHFRDDELTTEDDREPQRGRRSRRNSTDRTYFQRDAVEYREDAPNHDEFPPTPPYTPPMTPWSVQDVTQSPEMSPRRGLRGEDPSDVLQHSRDILRAGLEREQLGACLLSYSPWPTPDFSIVLPSFDRRRSLTPAHSATPSMLGSSSRRVSFTAEEDGISPAISPRLLSPTPSIHELPRSQSRDEDRGRRGSRFSLSNVMDAVKERMRSSSRIQAVDPASTGADVRDGSRSRVRDSTLEHSQERHVDFAIERGRPREKLENMTPKDNSLVRKKEKGPLGLFLRLDSDEGKEAGEGWKEFKKGELAPSIDFCAFPTGVRLSGTYTYPIAFTVPIDLPPTLHCDFGEVVWFLRATVHRPGAFTSRMTANKEVTLVSTPGEDDTEDTENIIVERQWENQLQYLIAISGRSFYIGGTIPINITMMPLMKIKVHRVSVFLDGEFIFHAKCFRADPRVERVDYLTQFKRVARSDASRRIVLLQLKREEGHLLPLSSDDPHAFKTSPLSDLFKSNDELSTEENETRQSELAASFMGPGPWSFETNVVLPKSCSQLHFTNKNKRSNISVTHSLKVVFRVERGDDEFVDKKTGKRKLFDIVIQTPVTIISVS
jgi:hypothetical protein